MVKSRLQSPAASEEGVSPRGDAAPGAVLTDAGDDQPLPTDFESAVTELEAVVQAMESGSLSLEASLAAYQRGARLATHCRRLLAEVQNRVKVLEGELLQPFDPDEGAS